MALLKGEGTHQILYGGADIFSGLRHNRGYLARPDHAGSFPAVLLIHGRAGLTSSVKAAARRLARHGLAVVAPDLFRGARSPRGPELPWPAASQIAVDVSGALQWMASPDTPWIDPTRVGVFAIDRGAAAAARLADIGEPVDGLVLVAPVFDGDPPHLELPVLGFYGKDDEVAGPEAREAARGALDQAEWVLYGGAGHGLVDEASPGYRWDVAEDVMERSVAFLSRLSPR